MEPQPSHQDLALEAERLRADYEDAQARLADAMSEVERLRIEAAQAKEDAERVEHDLRASQNVNVDYSQQMPRIREAARNVRRELATRRELAARRGE